jgi:hypothetical protein
MQPQLDLGRFHLSSTSVHIDGRPEVEEWLAPLQFAIWCQRASPWWIGDLLNAGDARFGEAFSQACQGIVSPDMLQRYESVARRVPPRNRRAGLSWSAHAAVARLHPDQQRQILDQAEEQGWNSEEMRVQVRKFLQNEGPSTQGPV